MSDKTRGIVLQHFRYSDTSLIVKVFTEQFGLQSYLLKGALSKRSRFRPALFQPLSVIDFVVAPGKQKELQFMSEAAISYPIQTLQQNPYKIAIVMFMSELVYKSLVDQEANNALFSYILDAIQWLDLSKDHFSDFPLYFSIELTRYLGFYPKINSYQANFHFDYMEGLFKANVPAHPYYLTKENSRLLNLFCQININQLATLTLTNDQRNSLLLEIINYYKLHLAGFKGLNSHEILHTVLR